jgi:hypothetical protein
VARKGFLSLPKRKERKHKKNAIIAMCRIKGLGIYYRRKREEMLRCYIKRSTGRLRLST